jgi:putative phosphoesterase
MSARHRIALISDIHGNALALHEVLRAIRASGADEIVCLGDVATLGVAPGEVIDTLRQLGCRCILGNHDEYLLDPGLIDGHVAAPPLPEAIAWCRDQLSGEQLEFVRSFARSIELAFGEGQTLRLFHGSPSSSLVDLLAETPSDVFDRQLGPERATVMAGGHTHIPMLRQHRGTLVVNPGSVGAPFRELPRTGRPKILAHAEYATVEFDRETLAVTLHRLPLDRRALEKSALSSPNPLAPELAAAYA